MAVLSDSIEQFIKSLMDEYDEMIEIQRNELADYFPARLPRSTMFWRRAFPPKRAILSRAEGAAAGISSW